MKAGTGQRFVSEPIEPLEATADLGGMAAGGPGLPREFLWRGRPFRVAAVIRTWRETGDCKHGSGEAYVRKHWFEVEVTHRRRATLYFERQARGRNRIARWWLYAIEEQQTGDSAGAWNAATPSPLASG